MHQLVNKYNFDKSKVWQHLVPDSITKHLTVQTTKPTTIYATFGNTLANFFVFLPMVCSNTKLVVSVTVSYTLLLKNEYVRYPCYSLRFNL